jgi:hypothetical protein
MIAKGSEKKKKKNWFTLDTWRRWKKIFTYLRRCSDWLYESHLSVFFEHPWDEDFYLGIQFRVVLFFLNERAASSVGFFTLGFAASLLCLFFLFFRERKGEKIVSCTWTFSRRRRRLFFLPSSGDRSTKIRDQMSFFSADVLPGRWVFFCVLSGWFRSR